MAISDRFHATMMRIWDDETMDNPDDDENANVVARRFGVRFGCRRVRADHFNRVRGDRVVRTATFPDGSRVVIDVDGSALLPVNETRAGPRTP